MPAPSGPAGGDPAASIVSILAVVLTVALVFAGIAGVGGYVRLTPREPVTAAGAGLRPLDFAALPGWEEDDHAAALAAFRRSCTGAGVREGTPLERACRRAARLPARPAPLVARGFFERNFVPFAVNPPGDPGLVTAYYEPEIAGSREPGPGYEAALYALPEAHVAVSEENRPPGFDETLSAGLRVADELRPYPARAEIQSGELAEVLQPLVWLENDVEAFFVHIQGSTRVRLPDGETLRIGFAGKNGHPYASIGRHMREAGIAPPEGLGMRGIRNYLLADPERGREIMAVNPSYIFFREIADLPRELGPVGAAGVPLTAGRSIAVDSAFHDYGVPVYVSAELGEQGSFRRLMIAQDTGSAIKGPARGDLFWGTGAAAGEAAGQVQAPARFVALLPK